MKLQHFTPWLAQEGNLALLSEAFKMNLHLEARELSIGRLRADIVCRDLFLDKRVVIENQWS